MRPFPLLLLPLLLACRMKAPVEPETSDADGDGWDVATDCDDANPEVFPFAEERCNGLDDDCDDHTDEDDAVDAAPYYEDLDGDGFGGDATRACGRRIGIVERDGDCDDGDARVYPTAEEVCDGVDNNCDDQLDVNALDATDWFIDGDHDGFGAGTAFPACAQPEGRVATDDDCEDSLAGVFPGAPETCNGRDDDCNGLADDDPVDLSTWYRDSDGDGVGGEFSKQSCEAEGGWVSLTGDCDDENIHVSPLLSETCNTEDNDCDGSPNESESYFVGSFYRFTDADGDTWGSGARYTCDAGAGVERGGDCDDADGEIYPSADEVCDGVDNDCVGGADQGALDALTWWPDLDEDGYGDDAEGEVRSCAAPAEGPWAELPGDCDDDNDYVNPGEIEACSDDLDSDCDGATHNGCPINHAGDITVSEVWEAGRPHAVTSALVIKNSATLTLRDGVEVRFAAGTGLKIGVLAEAKLVVEGTDLGVRLVPAGPGGWEGLWFGQRDLSSDLRGLSVEGAGSATQAAVLLEHASPSLRDLTVLNAGGVGVKLSNSSMPHVEGLWIEGSAQTGLDLTSDSELRSYTGAPALSASGLTDNGDYAAILPTDQVGQLGADLVLEGNAHDAIKVQAGNVTRSATWPGLRYEIAGDVKVGGTEAPRLTLAEGGTLAFASGAGLIVGGSDGSLEAREVVFTSANAVPSAGSWDGLEFGANNGHSVLEGVTVEYGGSASKGGVWLLGGDLNVQNSAITHHLGVGVGGSAGSLALQHSEVAHSAGAGVRLYNGGTLGADFSDNHIHDNSGYGLDILVGDLSDVGGDCRFERNGQAAIAVTGATLSASATWRDPGVPVRILSSVSVGDNSREPTLTLAPGLTLEFAGGTELKVGSAGIGNLLAVGTAEAPITLTASDPTAGWKGLTLSDHCTDAYTSLSQVEIAFGGKTTNANLTWDRCSGRIENSLLRNSFGYGMKISSASPTVIGLSYAANALGELAP